MASTVCWHFAQHVFLLLPRSDHVNRTIQGNTVVCITVYEEEENRTKFKIRKKIQKYVRNTTRVKVNAHVKLENP